MEARVSKQTEAEVRAEGTPRHSKHHAASKTIKGEDITQTRLVGEASSLKVAAVALTTQIMRKFREAKVGTTDHTAAASRETKVQ